MTTTSSPAGTATTTPDLLGEPWVSRRIPVTVSPAAPGADHAVLVHQRGAVPAPGERPRHERAVLYLHGRSDYFFQTWLADALLEAGYELYALDLRACGRAGRGYRSPHDVRDLRVHDEEVTEALRIIRQEHGHSTVVLNAHSTGGLQAVVWASDHPGSVEALTLNSPWLDLNGSALLRSYGSAWIDLLARRYPDRVIANPPASPGAGKALEGLEDDLYLRVLSRHSGGEWDWDPELKPSPAFPVRAGFLAGVRRLQREVHHGLGIEVPVLLCCSTASAGPEASDEEALRSDVVLSVRQMTDRAPCLGEDVTVHQVPGGVHDLALSGKEAREEYLKVLTSWLTTRLG